MYPKPEKLLEAINGVTYSENFLEEDKKIMKYIWDDRTAVYTEDDLFEARFKLHLNDETFFTYNEILEEFINDYSYRLGMDMEIFKVALFGLYEKILSIYKMNRARSDYYDYDRIGEGVMGRMPRKIEELEMDTSSPYIVHLPHAGIKIPNKFKDDYLLESSELEDNIYEYADYMTDEIYYHFLCRFQSVKNPYSRLFMDPERFFDDTNESMQLKHGLGWFYENAILAKKPLRTLDNKEIIAKYYHDHHTRLEFIVQEKLKTYDTCTIIDCHSFSNERYWFHDKSVELPDICIGFDEFHEDKALIELIKKEFKGYIININTPYAGSLVPTKYYMKDARVKSVMIEINKKLYLEKDNVTFSKDYKEIRGKFFEIASFLEKVDNRV